MTFTEWMIKEQPEEYRKMVAVIKEIVERVKLEDLVMDELPKDKQRGEKAT